MAIAAAVGGWSPVTIMTLIPADLHFLTANGTDYLGGSIKDKSPTKTNPSIGKLKLSGEDVLNAKPFGYFSLFKWSFPKPRTLSPFLPNLKLIAENLSFYSLSIFLNLPS